MKTTYQHLLRNRLFLTFIFLFAYAQSINIRLLIWGKLTWYIFTPDAAIGKLIDAAILYTIMLFFIRRWQASALFSTNEMVQIFTASLVVYLITIHLFGFFIAILFDNVARNFNSAVLGSSILSHLLDGFIYGSFFLAYYYYKKNNTHRQKLAIYHQAISENRIKQLKTQLNPHFLFNNLNVLDQLIQEDKNRATDFLHDFAEIYRYVLQTSEKKLISIHDEMVFLKQYFNIIQHKYGNAYQLHINLNNMEGCMVPLTFQLLIENAVQHNAGTEANPVIIRIDMDSTSHLRISNNRIQKRIRKTGVGLALNNLREQYHLVSNQQLQVQASETLFTILVPIVSCK